MSPRFAYLYFMKDDPDRVRAMVGRHVAYWQGLGLPGYLGGPFEAQDGDRARRAVDADPFVQEGLLEAHWLKQWTPE